MASHLKETLESILGEPLKDQPFKTGKIETLSGKEFFLKKGNISRTYQCEANGLTELQKAGVFALPEVMGIGEDFLITTYISPGQRPANFYQQLGHRLAQLHHYQSQYFGFYEDNFIGSNPQLNIPSKEEADNWTVFYFQKRLLYQYQMAERNGYVSSALRNGFSGLEKNIDSLLNKSIEPPTLLHGDLWSGNYLCNTQGEPVLIDPAVYYGHREADLAMTKIFGGFPTEFYQSYQKAYPLQEGWEEREPIYKLYHILNHLNLFGRSYLAEAEHLVSL